MLVNCMQNISCVLFSLSSFFIFLPYSSSFSYLFLRRRRRPLIVDRYPAPRIHIAFLHYSIAQIFLYSPYTLAVYCASHDISWYALGAGRLFFRAAPSLSPVAPTAEEIEINWTQLFLTVRARRGFQQQKEKNRRKKNCAFRMFIWWSQGLLNKFKSSTILYTYLYSI